MTERKRLRGKVAIVTGAGRGIGRAEALLLAEQGASVLVADFGMSEEHQALADGVMQEIVAAGGRAAAAREDISTFDGARRTVELADSHFGRLDFLIMSPSSSVWKPRAEGGRVELDAVVETVKE